MGSDVYQGGAGARRGLAGAGGDRVGEKHTSKGERSTCEEPKTRASASHVGSKNWQGTTNVRCQLQGCSEGAAPLIRAC